MTVDRPYTPTGPGAGSGQTVSGSGGRRVLGCVLGCFAAVVAVIALLTLIWLWISSPGAQVTTEPIVPEDAVAALRIEGLGEDEGFTELALEAMIQFDSAAREVQQQQLPDNLRWMAAFRGRKPRAKDLQKWLPREITVAVEAAPETDDGYSVVTAVNLVRYPRVVRFLVLRFMAGEEGRRWEHRGHPLVESDGTTIGFVRSTMLISDHAPAAERAIDQLVGAPLFGQNSGEGPNEPAAGLGRGVEAARELAALAAPHPGEWDIHGGFLNEENALAYAWWDLFDLEETGLDMADLEIRRDDKPEIDSGFERLAQGVEASWMAVDFATADEVRAVLAFRCRDGEAALAWSRQVEADLERFRQSAAAQGLSLDVVTTVVGDRLDVELEATAIRAWLEEAIAGFMTDMMGPSGPPGEEETEGSGAG